MAAGPLEMLLLYTLIETAKANKRRATKYLTRVFEKAAKMNAGDDKKHVTCE
jgi:hypothetical protein